MIINSVVSIFQIYRNISYLNFNLLLISKMYCLENFSQLFRLFSIYIDIFCNDLVNSMSMFNNDS